MSRKKRLQKKAEKGRKAEAKRQAYQAKIAAKARTKKKVKRVVPEGKVYIQSSFNNTMITVTDPQGGVVAWAAPAALASKVPANLPPTRPLWRPSPSRPRRWRSE